MNNPILAPAAVLILWSLIVLAWMAIVRFRAFAKAGIKLSEVPRGARYSDVEKEMPGLTNWPSHNFTHLMEQPTIYYAVVAVLALAGDVSQASLTTAWAYTGLRIAHSIWQNAINYVPVRALLFVVSTVALWVLAIRAVRITLF